MEHQISTWYWRFQVEYLNNYTAIVLTRETGYDGDSVWDDRESKTKTKHSLPLKREREIKTNKIDLYRNIVGERINTSGTEVRKSKVPSQFQNQFHALTESFHVLLSYSNGNWNSCHNFSVEGWLTDEKNQDKLFAQDFRLQTMEP